MICLRRWDMSLRVYLLRSWINVSLGQLLGVHVIPVPEIDVRLLDYPCDTGILLDLLDIDSCTVSGEACLSGEDFTSDHDSSGS